MAWDKVERRVAPLACQKQVLERLEEIKLRSVPAKEPSSNGDSNLLGTLGSMFLISILVVGRGILDGRK